MPQLQQQPGTDDVPCGRNHFFTGRT